MPRFGINQCLIKGSIIFFFKDLTDPSLHIVNLDNDLNLLLGRNKGSGNYFGSNLSYKSLITIK